MASTKTVEEVQELVGRDGYCLVPFSAVERVLAVTFADDDDAETRIAAMVASAAWLTAYEIDFVNSRVILRGPKT